METSQPLAIESFSYSWLSDHNKPSLDGLYDPPRESIDQVHNFNFDAIAQTHEPVIHADQLFTNGFIRPIFIDPSKREGVSMQTPISSPSSSSSSRSTGRRIPAARRIRFRFLRKYGNSTKKMLRNLVDHLRSLCDRLGCLRKSTRVDDIETRIMWSSSSSPQQIYEENSIYEAVLHCKRSIGK